MFWFRLDPVSWRFYPCLGGNGFSSDNPDLICVTGAPDVHAAAAAINASGGRPTTTWVIAYSSLVGHGVEVAVAS